MSHPSQQEFCESVKKRFPEYFKGKSVLDVGSLDINGCNRPLFEDCRYIGIDICAGKNVDVNAHLCDWITDKTFDVIISTEALEHDSRYWGTLQKMVNLLKSDGLLVLTCAAGNRKEHGTTKNKPEDSPKTNDWYMNMSISLILTCFGGDGIFRNIFRWFEIKENETDLYFWGIKR